MEVLAEQHVQISAAQNSKSLCAVEQAFILSVPKKSLMGGTVLRFRSAFPMSCDASGPIICKGNFLLTCEKGTRHSVG